MLTQKKVKTAILLYYHRKTGVLHAFVVYNLLALELISENHLYWKLFLRLNLKSNIDFTLPWQLVLAGTGMIFNTV